MRKAKHLIFVLILCLGAASIQPVRADACSWFWQCVEETESGCNLWARVCEPIPEYYVWQSVEPDWCIYAQGDRVAIQWQLIDGHAVITDWYVYPANDPAEVHLPRYVNGCGLAFD